MRYTHALCLMSGETVLITEKQAVDIRSALLNGAEWLPVGNELINSKSVAKVGYHHDTANAEKRQETMTDIKMISEGKSNLVDEKRRLQQKIAIDNAIKDNKRMFEELERKSLPMSETEDERGDAMFYIGDDGEKMFS